MWSLFSSQTVEVGNDEPMRGVEKLWKKTELNIIWTWIENYSRNLNLQVFLSFFSHKVQLSALKNHVKFSSHQWFIEFLLPIRKPSIKIKLFPTAASAIIQESVKKAFRKASSYPEQTKSSTWIELCLLMDFSGPKNWFLIDFFGRMSEFDCFNVEYWSKST